MFKFLMILLFYIMFMKFWNLMYLIIFIYLSMLMFYPSLYFNNLNLFFFFDSLNYWLILLTLYILFLMILSMNLIKFYNNNINLFMFMLIFMMLFLVFSFLSFNYLFFYIFFEMSLIPTLYLIMGWGYQPERIIAGVYLLFYTLVASLPLLISILYLKFYFKTMNFMNFNLFVFNNKLIYFSLVLAFLVKMPMFFTHMWLPKAHVEAPIAGSMILAAILLKLGGYGLLRVMGFLILYKDYNMMVIIFSIFGGILISLNCLRQLDIKMLIAYSSVAHMGMVLGGLFTLNYWGISGSFLMMIAHGLCSSGLFCLANINYERINSRSMLLNKGLMNFMPSMSLWWFLLSASNMSSPLSLNLISEIKLINSIFSYSMVNLILLFFLCFFSASYCYYMFSFSQHGSFYSSIYSYSNNNQREYMLIMFHWLPLNLLFMKILFLF